MGRPERPARCHVGSGSVLTRPFPHRTPVGVGTSQSVTRKEESVNEDIEQQLRAAIDSGDSADIDRLAALMDAADRQPEADPNLLGAALWYASVGLHVFPLRQGEKIPHAGTHGCKDATTDADTIRAWWERWPGSNVAIATGHRVDVVDIDGHEGQKARIANWDNIFAKVDRDKLAVVLTPRPGGMHIYVPSTGDGNKAGILTAIDYRGAGGYVVAPPSIITVGPNQGTYTFLGQPSLTPDEAAA